MWKTPFFALPSFPAPFASFVWGLGAPIIDFKIHSMTDRKLVFQSITLLKQKPKSLI